jgi:hypothetical protein
MSAEDITGLLAQAPFGFVGTVEHLGAATLSSVPIDESTAVVRVDLVLQAPQTFAGLEGQRITLRLKEPIQEGEQATFFAQGLVFGESIAVEEVGRLPVERVEPHLMAGAAADDPPDFGALRRRVAVDRLREHADGADAVVVGRGVWRDDVLRPPYSEHDPDWWRATVDVVHVERGDIAPGPLGVLYANSLDVRWRTAPKPKASQEGLWILHATEGAAHEAAPFQIIHPEDFQPVQSLDDLRGEEG